MSNLFRDDRAHADGHRAGDGQSKSYPFVVYGAWHGDSNERKMEGSSCFRETWVVKEQVYEVKSGSFRPQAE